MKESARRADLAKKTFKQLLAAQEQNQKAAAQLHDEGRDIYEAMVAQCPLKHGDRATAPKDALGHPGVPCKIAHVSVGTDRTGRTAWNIAARRFKVDGQPRENPDVYWSIRVPGIKHKDPLAKYRP